jgi:hypothetical protein
MNVPSSSTTLPPISRKAVLAVFALALAVRVTFVLVMRPGYPGSEMIKAASGLATRGSLSDVYGKGPTAHVAPLYPALLAGLYTICGADERSFPVLGQQLLAALTTAATIALVPVLARRLGLRPAAGWAAAVCLALLPVHSVEVDGRWEQPFTALVLAGLLLVAARLQDCDFRSLSRAAAFGLLMAAGGLLAPVILPAAGLALLGCWVASRANVLRGLAAGAVVALVCMVVWAPWIMRNYRELGGFVPLRSNFGLELRLGNSPGADGMGLTLRHTHPSVDPEQEARLRTLGELPYMREQQEIALDWIADHPDDFAALCGRRFLLFWFPPPAMCLQSLSFVGTAVSALFRVTAVLSLVGLLWLILTRHRYRWLIATGLLGPALVYIITHVLIRYRYPVFFLSMLVAWELVFILASLLSSRRNLQTVPREDVREAYAGVNGAVQ